MSDPKTDIEVRNALSEIGKELKQRVKEKPALDPEDYKIDANPNTDSALQNYAPHAPPIEQYSADLQFLLSYTKPTLKSRAKSLGGASPDDVCVSVASLWNP